MKKKKPKDIIIEKLINARKKKKSTNKNPEGRANPETTNAQTHTERDITKNTTKDGKMEKNTNRKSRQAKTQR